MSEYIKRDDALNIDFKIIVRAFENRKTTATNAVQAYADAIAKIPSEDVRPVVLCRDCYAYRRDKELAEAAYLDPGMYCGLLRCEMGEDSFCSYGKRKGEKT